MEKHIILPEAMSSASNDEKLHWDIVEKTLYVKGCGCVKDLAEVGYHCDIDTIVIGNNVFLHENILDERRNEKLRYLVTPPDWYNRFIWEDPEEEHDVFDLVYTFPNVMLLEKGEEVEVIFASYKLVEAVIPDYATIIGETSFASGALAGGNYSKLSSIVIPASIKEIRWAAFHGCQELKKVIISQGVSIIGSNAFQSCVRLESVEMPDSVTVIGAGAFEFCSSLKNISLPSNLLVIGGNAFGHMSIKNMHVPDCVTNIGFGAFAGIENVVYYGSAVKNTYYDCEFPTWEWGCKKINGITAYEWEKKASTR